jgi:GNAT superfamily N-acetyltransferase
VRWHTLAAVLDGFAARITGQAGFLAGLDTLADIYGAAMQAPREQLPGRRAMMERHSGYPELRAVLVTDDRGRRAPGGAPGGQDSHGSHDGHRQPGPVIAFTYGFRGSAGQWWHDVVRTGLTAAAGAPAAAWWLADSFEVAEVHVRPAYQGHGIGRDMVLALMAGCERRTALLSTQDTWSPARRLYGRLGFTDLLTGFCFPGGGPPYAVMGAALPLAASEPVPGARPSR